MEDLTIQLKQSRRTKFAIFDFDGTIAKPQAGRQFPKDAADWQYTRASVPSVLQKFGKTHHVVIVTDQTKSWKVDQIKAVMTDLQIEHITAVIGFQTHKPDTTHFLKVFPKFKPENAFYVGDAAGRKGDWSDVDKKFAENLNVEFIVPESIFPLDEIKAPKLKPSAKKEVVIMVGYPASGKSTIARDVFEAAGYHIVSGDKFKSIPAMIADAKTVIAKQSVVFDSTAGTKAKRKEYVDFAHKLNLPVRVVWVQTPIDVAMERNKQRGAEGGPKIPAVAYYLYRKHFEPPQEEEGFKLVTA